jgi:outer membrane protein assembly factor BamB
VAIAAAAAVAALVVGCGPPPPIHRADAMRAVPLEPLGEDRLALHWRFAMADRRTEVQPQELAQAVVAADTVYVGSAAGVLYALRAGTGQVRWRKRIGAMATAPRVAGGLLYLATADGALAAHDAQTGEQRWRYQSRGPIQQPPVITTELVLFSNEADQVVALDGITGKLKWQYKGETPEEYTLRGHAGVAIDGDLVYSGFSNGIVAALRKDTGTLAWSTSLKAEADRFVDVDATPLVIGDRLIASSSSGGVYSLDKTTGLVRWRMPFWDVAQPSASGNVGGVASDGKVIYATVADLGAYALDLDGNVLWRVGGKGGGEPATPVVWNELLLYTLAEAGLFVLDRRTGETLEYFDPGDGISAAPTVTGSGQLLVLSNRGVLYSFDLE